MQMNELGTLLRELRGKKSLRQVADSTGLSHSYISDIENGYRRGSKTPLNPTPETLKRLSQAYDYSYEKLMELAGYIKKEVTVNVADKEISLTEDELLILNKIKQQPLLFHKLADAPEKKIKALIRMWEALETAEEDEDEDIIED
jgi:HTH-type transcriptional regulator, competence development regulator